MRVSVVTIFPDAFESFLRAGLLGKAIGSGHVEVDFADPRDFTEDRHRSVDDAPYGGGSGMVMTPGPLMAAVESLEAGGKAHRALMTPQGQPFGQKDAQRLSRVPHLVLVCGRYEGVDERVREAMDEELSLGDFVLMGGEVAAMAVLEATARLLDGVLGNQASAQDESHVAGLLEYPQYTRPPEYRDQPVPEVLRSGDHAAIARWRRRESLRRTRLRRPELLTRIHLDENDLVLLGEIEAEDDT